MLNANYTVTVEPAVEPITLTDLKTRLRITVSEFDDELTHLIKAARKQVELDSHRALIEQTVTLNLDAFPAGKVIELRKPPVSSVTSVAYVDDNRASQTFASSKYTVDLNSTPPRIMLLDEETWETTEPNYPGAVTVTFVAGYGTATTDLPVEAILATVEWVRLHWGDCDGDGARYRNLINSLAWSGYWNAV